MGIYKKQQLEIFNNFCTTINNMTNIPSIMLIDQTKKDILDKIGEFIGNQKNRINTILLIYEGHGFYERHTGLSGFSDVHDEIIYFSQIINTDIMKTNYNLDIKNFILISTGCLSYMKTNILNPPSLSKMNFEKTFFLYGAKPNDYCAVLAGENPILTEIMETFKDRFRFSQLDNNIYDKICQMLVLSIRNYNHKQKITYIDNVMHIIMNENVINMLKYDEELMIKLTNQKKDEYTLNIILQKIEELKKIPKIESFTKLNFEINRQLNSIYELFAKIMLKNRNIYENKLDILTLLDKLDIPKIAKNFTQNKESVGSFQIKKKNDIIANDICIFFLKMIFVINKLENYIQNINFVKIMIRKYLLEYVEQHYSDIKENDLILFDNNRYSVIKQDNDDKFNKLNELIKKSIRFTPLKI